MGDHTRNYCAAIYFFLVTYIFFLHEPRVIDPALSSDGDKVGWCLTKRGRTRGCINKEKLGSNTRKNTIQKNCHTIKIAIQKNHHTKNVRVFSHTKKYHTKKLPYKKFTMYYTHTKNCHTKKYYIIHHTKKLLCIFSHTKNYYVFFPIQKITMYSHTHKNLLCSTHTKKLPYIFYYVFFPIQKITM